MYFRGHSKFKGGAFLFRPVKERFKIPWFPHELQVLCSFAAIAIVVFLAFDTARNYVPDDQQKLELKVRLKYKLNTKYQQLTMEPPEGKSSMLVDLIKKQVDPLMDKVNDLLELDPQEREQFLKYRAGYNGNSHTENKFFEYFQVNQNTRKYVTSEGAPVAPAATTAVAAQVGPHAAREGSSVDLIAENIAPLVPGLNPNNLPLYVLILVGVTRILDDVVFQPFVLGSAVNIHPLVVVVAIIGGSLIMGLWGMVFAIPTVVVVKTAVETLFKELNDYRII
jgi:hypothetical protein